MTIKAIETVYKGYRFRSRLEARWAVFFDEMGYDWEYESEGYQLSDGTWYLPDFKVNGEFFEIKGQQPEYDEWFKLYVLSHDTSINGHLLSGDPLEFYIYSVYNIDEDKVREIGLFNEGSISPFMFDMEKAYPVCRELAPMQFSEMMHITDSQFSIENAYSVESKFLKAALKARQARFEHGE